MLRGCFSAAGTEQSTEILDDNLLQSPQDLRLRRRFTFQHHNNPKHTAKKTQEWLLDKSLNVLEWPNQSPDMDQIEQRNSPNTGVPSL